MDQPTRQLCTFHAGNLFLGIDVRQVQEVFRYQKMTRVPLAPGAVRGLINLRGQIVTAIDLRARLGLPERSGDRLPMNIVVRQGEDVVTLLVDEIGDVIEVTADSFESSPPTLRGPIRTLVEGAYKLPQGLLLVLNTNEAVDVSHSESALASV